MNAISQGSKHAQGAIDYILYAKTEIRMSKKKKVKINEAFISEQ